MADTSEHPWIYIPGFSNYRANNLGQIYSIRRRGSRGCILKHHIDEKGYPHVTITDDSGKVRCVKVHQLIALVFHGPRPEGMVVRHWPDRDPMNNRPENLEYGTYSENAYDQVRHGTHAEAAKTHCRNGHPLSEDNLLTRRNGKGGYRRCKECHRINIASYRARKSASGS